MNDEMLNKALLIWDTTLRDGEQMPGAMLDPEDKAAVASALAHAGTPIIEAGFPAVSDSEERAVRLAAQAAPDSIVIGFCRAVKADVDAARRAFEGCGGELYGVSVSLATSPIHRERKLKKSRGETLAMITKTIEYAKKYFPVVCFGAEDASRTEPPFLCAVYSEAIKAGASIVNFPDTLGVLTPETARERVLRIQEETPNRDEALLSVHFHNDLGLAVANTLAAAGAGADVAQCTVNGLGERAGNAALEEVVLALALHCEQYGRATTVEPSSLSALCALVAEKVGIPIAVNKPVVGANIFSTAAGIHQDGLLKAPETYLPYPPEMVGAEQVRFVLGKHSGRAALGRRFRDMGFDLSEEELQRASSFLKNADKGSWEDEAGLLAAALKRARTK